MGCSVTESSGWYEQINEVEAIVRSAGNYVRVSKDLRPRVLERARVTSGERRARRHIRHLGLIAALLLWTVTASIDRLETDVNLRRLTLVAAAPSSLSARGVNSNAGDSAWALVDAYTELRGRQAAVLRLAF